MKAAETSEQAGDLFGVFERPRFEEATDAVGGN
jgi:hypothetical protein